MKIAKCKKGQFLSGLNMLSASAISLFIFALIVVVTLAGIQSVKDGQTNAQITGNITTMQTAYGGLTSNAGLIVTVIVFSVVIMLVSSAFGGGRRQ